MQHNYNFNNKYQTIVSPTEPTTDRKKVWLQHSDNMYDGTIDKTGYILSSDGSETSNTDGFISNFQKVNPNTTYTISYNSTDLSFGMRIGEYTTNKSWIKRLFTNENIYTFTISSTTEYIKISGKINAVSNIKLEEGSTVMQDKEYILNDNNIYEEVKLTNTVASNINVNPTDTTDMNIWISTN